MDTDGRGLRTEGRMQGGVLDIIDRRVMEQRPGENDIRRVALGVHAVMKATRVVLTRAVVVR